MLDSDAAVHREIRRLRSHQYLKYLQRIRDAIGRVIQEASLSIHDVSLNVSLATSVDRFYFEGSMKDKIYRIKEDSICKKTFSEFFEIYSQLPSSFIPKFFIEKNSTRSEIDRRLEFIPDSFEVQDVSFEGILKKNNINFSGATSRREVLQLFGAACYAPATRLNLPKILDSQEHDEFFVNTMSILCQMRALSMEGKKFDSIRIALKLDDAIRSYAAETRWAVDREKCSYFKAINNLWLVYCEENNRSLYEGSLKFARAIDDEILEGQSLKVSGIFERNRDAVVDNLDKAVGIFNRNKLYDQSVYCTNNLLLTELYRDGAATRRYEALLETVEEFVPQIAAKPSILNNAAVAAMQDNNYLAAIDFLNAAESLPKTNLVRLGIGVNSLLAQYFLGMDANVDDVEQVGRSVLRSVDPRYGQQRGLLMFNLLQLLVKQDKKCNGLKALISEAQLYNDPKVRAPQYPLSALVGELTGTTLRSLVDWGDRGRFFHNTGFVPIIFNSWI